MLNLSQRLILGCVLLAGLTVGLVAADSSRPGGGGSVAPGMGLCAGRRC